MLRIGRLASCNTFVRRVPKIKVSPWVLHGYLDWNAYLCIRIALHKIPNITAAGHGW